MSEQICTFDKLQMYFMEPFSINNIVVKQPTIGDILQFGENRFYRNLNIFTTNTTINRLTLWNMGRDWNKMSNFDLFCMLINNLRFNSEGKLVEEDEDNSIETSLIFGDLDFSKFIPCQKKTDDDMEIVLYNRKQNVEIDENTYNVISQYLRTMFDMSYKEEKVKGKMAKEFIIEEEKLKLESLKAEKDDEPKSYLLPLISSCVNHPGFKYKVQELRDVGIYQFMDSVRRLQIYESSVSIMRGMHSGFVDGSKIKPETYNFMR